MFHTFEGFGKPRNNNRGDDGQSGRRTTARACEQCRRRKIRCDGEQPCEACRWYKKVELCHYSDPRPSRRHVEKLSAMLGEYKVIVEKLFPNTSPQSLVHLSREELLELALDGQRRQQRPVSPVTSPPVESHVSSLSPDDENLESLQTMPEESGDSRGSDTSDVVAGISDDVNALSLSTKQPSSYLGVSSVHAVLRVIVWIDPGSLSYFSRTPSRTARNGHNVDWSSRQRLPPQPQMDSQRLIDAYFGCFHVFTPLLDEASFRETYLSGRRTDARWLALLNIVLALGSIAAGTADDTSHQIYFRRSKSYLDLDSLGSAHLETVQTLGLMGGFYLHYINQPGLAYSLVGAALRMAVALGMHKEFVDSREGVPKQKLAFLDLRRRVWWSLVCVDTWGSMTLGRPSMGRWGQAITAKLPQYSRERGNVLSTLPLVENIRFGKIATQVQEALAVSPLVNYPEMVNLDNQLVEWYDNIPPLLKDHEPCPEIISTVRAIMRWRYQNQRMLLHRPALLSYAMRRIPYVALRSEERTAIEKCRAIAEETIRDIASPIPQGQMSGWNAVWFLFQAAIIPLLGLFIADDTAEDPRARPDACRAQVEMAMTALARMEPWSPTAKRTLDVVSRIFEASRRSEDPSDGRSSANGMQAPSDSTPTVVPSQQDTDRSIDSTIPDLGPQLLDESAGMNMWDYIMWSDHNLWPGLPDHEFEGGMDLFRSASISEDQNPKSSGGGVAFPGMGPGMGMSDGSYFDYSIPFQQ